MLSLATAVCGQCDYALCLNGESIPSQVSSMAVRSKRHPKLLELIAVGDGKENVDSLAVALNVSSKTIRRDLDDLRSLGFAILEHGVAHAPKTLSIDKQSLSQLRLTYDEAFALMLYRLGNSSFDGTLFGQAAVSAFSKVEGTMGPVEKDYVRRMMPRVRRISVGSDYSNRADTVEALTIGIEDAKAIEITYLSARSTEPVTYVIEPYGLVEHRGTLYVVGHSRRHEEIRTWKLDRMLAAEVTRRSFKIPAGFDINQHFLGAFAIHRGGTTAAVTVRFTGSAVRYVQEKRMHPSQRIELKSDGSAHVHFELSSTVEVRSWILSFGSVAEVLSPDSLREEIRNEIAQMLVQYDPNGLTTGQQDSMQRDS